MPNYYWIKFYVEVLDDSKMATLPDRLWRRFYELCLIAGSEGQQGIIPSTQRLAWKLRMQTDDLALDLTQLAAIGLIEQIQDGWTVCNFAKRQAPIPSDKRYEEFRKRNPQYIPPGLQQTTNVTQTQRLEITDNREQITDNRTETESSSSPQNSVLYTTRDAGRAYLQVTGFAAVPNDVYPYLESILSLLNHDGWDGTIAKLTDSKNNWCSQTRKDGQPYRIDNPKWIDNAVTGVRLGTPPELSRDDRELLELNFILGNVDEKGNPK